LNKLGAFFSVQPQDSIVSLGKHVQFLLMAQDCSSATVGRAVLYIFHYFFLSKAQF